MKRAVNALSRRARWLIVLGVPSVAMFSVLVPLQTIFYGTPLPVAMLLGAGVCSAPLVSVTYPRVAIAAFGLAAFALPFAVSSARDPAAPWPWSVPMLVAFTVFVLTLTVAHGWQWALVPWGVSNVGGLGVLLLLPDAVTVGMATANLIVTVSVTAGAILLGVLVAERIRVGDELSKSRELTAIEQSRRVLVEERTRIARELHDVVAHSMSVIQVQASSARYRISELPEDAVTEFDDIAAATRDSLAEMRRLLGVLRTDDRQQERSPQQTIADIPALVESVRRAGVPVRLSTAAPRGTIPPGVEIAAFRIVQEALSNAVRHAPGSSVDVELHVTDAAMTVRVHNDGAVTAPGSPSSNPAAIGHGLLGMRERVALLTGSLNAGPDPAGGWTVTAVLPWADSGEEHA